MAHGASGSQAGLEDAQDLEDDLAQALARASV